MITLICLTLLKVTNRQKDISNGYFQWTFTLFFMFFFVSMRQPFVVRMSEEVSITMPGCIDAMLEKNGLTRVQRYSTNNDLFLRDENSPE